MLEFEEGSTKTGGKSRTQQESREDDNQASSKAAERTHTAVMPRVLVQLETVIPFRIRVLKILPRLLLSCGLMMGFYGYQHRGALADLSLSPAELSEDPTQLEVEEDSFPLHYRGQTYTVEPVADYEFAGLVVTRNNISAWDDIYHTGDSVDVVDLCVVWGSNLNVNLLSQFKFWSEPWTCNYQTESRTAAEQFVGPQLSNNHLLPANEGIGKQLASIQIGDQVRVRGKLINYYPEGQEERRRKSSTVRTDSGNGACEVVYVESLSIISRGTPLAYRLWSFGKTMILVAILFSLVNFFVIPLSYYRANQQNR